MSYDRAREATPGAAPTLRLVEGSRGRKPAGKGFGFCLACHAEGKVTVAADPIAGDACLQHIRSAS